MIVSTPNQTHAGERRVALTPDVTTKLITSGHTVLVESDAGTAAGFRDDQYLEAGAQIVSAQEAWGGDLVAVVEPPDRAVTGYLARGSVLIGLLAPLEQPGAMRRLADAGVTALAFELLPRITRAQSMDALSSQATVAGYEAVIVAADHLPKFFPMLTTAAGTIAPARVIVLGAGVAGLQAIATARRLGAVVSSFDVRSAAAEQVQSLGATFIDLTVERQDEKAAGGYARELAKDDHAALLEGLTPHITAADAVISTAQIPGRPAPTLITDTMVEAMRPGSVIVDVAAPTGGNCTLTAKGEVVDHQGVTIVGWTDLPSRVAADASRMYARNVLSLIGLISDPIDLSDEVLEGCAVTHAGKITNERVRGLLEGV